MAPSFNVKVVGRSDVFDIDLMELESSFEQLVVFKELFLDLFFGFELNLGLVICGLKLVDFEH